VRLALVAAFATGCAAPIAFDTPIPDDGAIPRDPAAGPLRDALDQAAAFSRDRGGLALLVLRGPTLVYEDYAPGYDPASPRHLFSGTKSFSCPAVLALQERGVLALDEPVGDTLAPLADRPDLRVAHLLDFTSGLSEAFWRLTVDGMRQRQRVADKAAVATAQPSDWAAGARYRYGSVHQWVLSGLIHAKTGQPALAAIRADLLEPIGLRVAGWHHDPAGNTALAYGAWTTALEWAKFGLLMRDDGVYQGQRVLPPGAAARCFEGSAVNPAYGLTFWLNAPVGADADLSGIRTLDGDGPIFGDAPPDTVAAAGHEDQRLYIIPSLDLVIVRLGEGDRAFRDAELLAEVLGALASGS
jgi:CubicO group peptidase (beta-lactamase class C family)